MIDYVLFRRNDDDTEGELGREEAETPQQAVRIFGKTIVGCELVIDDDFVGEFVLRWFDGGVEERRFVRRK